MPSRKVLQELRYGRAAVVFGRLVFWGWAFKLHSMCSRLIRGLQRVSLLALSGWFAMRSSCVRANRVRTRNIC